MQKKHHAAHIIVWVNRVPCLRTERGEVCMSYVCRATRQMSGRQLNGSAHCWARVLRTIHNIRAHTLTHTHWKRHYSRVFERWSNARGTKSININIATHTQLIRCLKLSWAMTNARQWEMLALPRHRAQRWCRMNYPRAFLSLPHSQVFASRRLMSRDLLIFSPFDYFCPFRDIVVLAVANFWDWIYHAHVTYTQNNFMRKTNCIHTFRLSVFVWKRYK